MYRITTGLALILVLGLSSAHAQNDSVLDDASDVASTATGSADPVDDASLDPASGLDAGQATTGPLAFGTVTSSGSKFSGTSNFTSSYNSSFKRYEISISGESYYYLRYATLITPAGDTRFCKSSSVGGKLLVYCYDSNGQSQPARFGFVTFKP